MADVMIGLVLAVLLQQSVAGTDVRILIALIGVVSTGTFVVTLAAWRGVSDVRVKQAAHEERQKAMQERLAELPTLTQVKDLDATDRHNERQVWVGMQGQIDEVERQTTRRIDDVYKEVVATERRVADFYRDERTRAGG